MNNTNHIPPGYKPNALGSIPDDWGVKHFEDVANIFVGRDLNEKSYSQNKTDEHVIPVYSNTVENEGLYGYYNIGEYNGESLTVVGRGVGLGTAFTRKGKYGAIGRLLVVFPKANNVAHYLTEYINGKLKLHTESSGIPQLTGEQFGKYKVLIPPYGEQTAIANLLSTWDKAIQTTTALIAQKEQRKKWLMQQLLTGKRRLKRFQKNSWMKFHSGDIFKNVSIKGNRQEELLSATQDKGIIPRRMLDARVTMPSGDTDSFKLVDKGDFVISLRSFQGGIEYSYYRGLVSPAYTVLKPIKKINDEFYKQYFKSYDFIEHLSIAVIGIRDGKQINYEDFCFVKIPCPSYEEQTAIAAILQASDKEIKLLKAKTKQLKQQKKGLMQQLLTGKKRLKF